MGETLKIANEKAGYTLVDRATWLLDEGQAPGPRAARRGRHGAVQPVRRHPVAGAKNRRRRKAFKDWILSPEGQKVIGEFGVDKYGQQIFVPDAGK